MSRLHDLRWAFISQTPVALDGVVGDAHICFLLTMCVCVFLLFPVAQTAGGVDLIQEIDRRGTRACVPPLDVASGTRTLTLAGERSREGSHKGEVVMHCTRFQPAALPIRRLRPKQARQSAAEACASREGEAQPMTSTGPNRLGIPPLPKRRLSQGRPPAGHLPACEAQTRRS